MGRMRLPKQCWSLIALTCGFAPLACAQQQYPAPLVQLARGALEPESGQSVQITRQPAPASWRGLEVWRGNRVPPFGRGMEDARPSVAFIIASKTDTCVVGRPRDLPSAWALVFRDSPRDSAQALADLLELLLVTNWGGSAQSLVTRRAQVSYVDIRVVDHPAELDSVAAPSVRSTTGGYDIRLYAQDGCYLRRYVFSVSSEGTLEVHSEILSRLGVCL